MGTPPPPPSSPPAPSPSPQNGPGFAGFPQQPPAPNSPPGFGPPPGLPSAPGAPGGRRSGGLRRNATWAFVGAILASAVWTGTVLAVPGLVDDGSGAKSLRGYHAVDRICDAGKLTAFRGKYKMVDNYPLEHVGRTDTMDVMRCYALMKRTPSDSETTDYATLDIRAELHRAVDSAPEFAALRQYFEQQKYEITPVPGLGEEAYLAYGDEPTSSDKTFHDINYYLQIRDGGMTYSLYWTDNYQVGKNHTLDRETVRKAMLDDTRDMLRAIGSP
ncbi:hypothetical protein OG401_14560 [Kitasatospora purpeofusca]|uniref:hypothetical protein n=1 Tax=Kitasatospora purpeofusca TaxID=67352 RepID=UPI002252FBBE|nr:hypothetical protein [Kitasatospora purpeofusca]MCX4685522.1 hypothetical protein [Kitasatospora purpeofusca]